ncbi:MAG: PEP-CTERM sorting domain-containing protein, partial [Chitinophagaceae bacterium]|nr:PEP-CTERM sorting domain-containing protein [Rubrivivax sp.]
YTFLTTALFDPFVILYAPTFTATTPLVNAQIANDDLLGQTTSGFTFALVPNTVYRYVTTGFANTDFGTAVTGVYTTTIGGIGTITVVPEASTYAMMAMGLAMLGIARRRTKTLPS